MDGFLAKLKLQVLSEGIVHVERSYTSDPEAQELLKKDPDEVRFRLSVFPTDIPDFSRGDHRQSGKGMPPGVRIDPHLLRGEQTPFINVFEGPQSSRDPRGKRL